MRIAGWMLVFPLVCLGIGWLTPRSSRGGMGILVIAVGTLWVVTIGILIPVGEIHGRYIEPRRQTSVGILLLAAGLGSGLVGLVAGVIIWALLASR